MVTAGRRMYNGNLAGRRAEHYGEDTRDMKGSDVPFNISLPLLGIGLLSLLLSLTFCCYMWRLRCKARQEQGYRRIKFKTGKKRKLPNDTCPVCIEEFEQSEYVAICPCNHCFHMKCLLEWLRYQNACPMCKAPVQSLPSPGERTGLIPLDRRTQSSETPGTSTVETV
ncbi:RING finger protein 24-like isoform X1 [Ylistrum balloti]|uniref:RING finger protein 24-like isoform X1 n=2 Tax=Ylistrum balloti TaxID=509963 RepID=UPI002905DB22|nr:RING finger protein 24-like isoform X1 [Ylistrum balloti]